MRRSMRSSVRTDRTAATGLPARFENWVGAGLLSPEQAEAIVAFEHDRSAARGRVAEAVGYVGAAFAVGAVGLLLADLWDRFVPGARLALAVLLTMFALGSGFALRARTEAAMVRLTGVLWTAGLAGVAATTGLLGSDVLQLSDRSLPLLVGGTVLVVASGLLWLGRHALVQVVVLIALVFTGSSVLDLVSVLAPDSRTIGVLLIGTGLAWALAGAGRWLGPRRLAEILGLLIAYVGTQVLAVGDRRLLGLTLGVILASALVVIAIPTGQQYRLVLGALGLFVGVPRLVLALFADTLGAPLSLLTVGVLLIVMAVGFGRARQGIPLRRTEGVTMGGSS